MKNFVRLLRRRKSTTNTEDESQRQLAYHYYIPNDQNNTLKVSKSFLIIILNINSDTLSKWIKKMQDNAEGDKELRSKHEKRQSKVVKLNQSTKKVRKSDIVKE